MSFRVIYRKEKLLEEIINLEGYITSEYLSRKFGVSSRTIRQDVKLLSSELKENGIELRAVPSKGYYLNKNDREKTIQYLESLKPITTIIPTLPVDRTKFIIRKILFGKENIDIENLAEELFISYSTIEKDIQEIKKWFTNQGLELVNRKHYGIYLIGTEISKRYAMVNYFSDFDDFSSLPDLKDLKETIGEEYVEPIKHLLYKIYDTEDISLSDADFLNLTIYLSVSLLRISNQNEIKQIDPEFSSIEIGREYSLATKISSQIKQEFSINLSRAELVHLAKYLMQANIPATNVRDYFFLNEKDLSKFIYGIITEINSRFSLDFSKDTDLINGLSLYLNSLIIREKYKAVIKNPGLGEIVKEYPEALEMAVAISRMIKDEYDIVANKHEIGYIALYFCAALERQRIQKEDTVKKVVIICATGVGGSQLLAVKIKRNFPNLEIIGVYPAYRLDEAVKQNPDFIISTNPIEDTVYPVVQISHLLNNDDLIHIKKSIDNDSDLKYGLELNKLFRPELYFAEIVSNERADVISFLCEKIKMQGYVDDNFVHAVLERESVFPTAIGNLVAIPHALTNKFLDSWIAVGILKKPILWGNDLAQLILLLNIDNSKEENFNTIYEILYDRVNDKKIIERLLRTTKFDEFLKVINE